MLADYSVRETPLHAGSRPRRPGEAGLVGTDREKAPRLFVQELAAIVAKLREGADEQRQEVRARGGVIWRILMPETGNHVYYRLDETAREVEILLVWNAAAGKSKEV